MAEAIQPVPSALPQLHGQTGRIGASIGICLGDGRFDSADALPRDSDTAMYPPKAAGRGRHVVFDRHGQMKASEARDWRRLPLPARLTRFPAP